MNNIEKLIKEIEYSICIQYITDEDNSYYYVYIPEFGHAACSAPGDTLKEALEALKLVMVDVIACYKEDGDKIPKPHSFS